MRLSSFISAHLEEILAEWVAFARTQLPAADALDETALRDHGKLILEEIAADMQRPQDGDAQQAKSEGIQEGASSSSSVPSRSHARQRERQGFEIEQMVAEYRALRATVLRLWKDAAGGVHGLDLDDMTRFNEAVDQAMAESLKVFVFEMNRTRELFLGMLGHDMRGPLSAIAACAAIDKRKRPTDATGAIVLRSVAQMKALLDDLVEFTRHRLGAGLAVDPAPLDLDVFARDTLDEIAAVSSGRVIELITDGDMHGEWDARRLHQALSNLVFNALKYGFPDAPVVVTLDGSRADDVVIAVRNTGPAIPPALLPQLFDPLVRAESDLRDADSQVAGANLGLGLYVVREIASAHGGSVTVVSDDLATRFEFRMPRVCERGR